MKSFVVSFTLLLGTSVLTARGEDPMPLGSDAGSTPKASLGIPRAAMGTPAPLSPTPSLNPLVPTPALTPPVARAQIGPLVSPYSQTSTPQRMPQTSPSDVQNLPVPAAVPISQTPIVSTPIVSSPISSTPGAEIPSAPIPDLEEPLFGVPSSVPPFIANLQRFRVSAEYLMWWTHGAYVPQLVTTGPAASNGFLGSPGVTTLIGGGPLTSSFQQGFRVGFLAYLDPCLKWGVDGNYFFIANTGGTYSFNSNTAGDPLLARPFNNVNNNIPFSELVAYPGVLQGGVKVSTGTTLWGADLNLRRNIAQWNNSRLDFLMGYRHLTLDEYVNIDESSVGLPGSIASGLNAYAYDHFRTTNNFNGGQIGLAFERTAGRWVFDVRGKVAFGLTSQAVDVQGGQIIFNPNGSTTNYQGGLLALPSNIGSFTKSEFSVVPELTLNIGYNITDRCRVFVGGNFLYWTNVVRAGGEIDTNVNINQVPNFTTSANAGTAHPTVQFHEKDYWAMGLNFGFMFRW